MTYEELQSTFKALREKANDLRYDIQPAIRADLNRLIDLADLLYDGVVDARGWATNTPKQDRGIDACLAKANEILTTFATGEVR